MLLKDAKNKVDKALKAVAEHVSGCGLDISEVMHHLTQPTIFTSSVGKMIHFELSEIADAEDLEQIVAHRIWSALEDTMHRIEKCYS